MCRRYRHRKKGIQNVRRCQRHKMVTTKKKVEGHRSGFTVAAVETKRCYG